MMKRIKELAPKPSDAIQAMIYGLKNQSMRSDFDIHMSTFGSLYKYEIDNSITCFGCAATCAIQQLAKKNFVGEEIIERDKRAIYLDFDFKDLSFFEDAIDALRKMKNGLESNLLPLMKYYKDDFNFSDHGDLFDKIKSLNIKQLTNFDWKDNLVGFEKLVLLLKEYNL